ncbi:CoA pyrophosphatase [SAR202 cluster bacterium AC-647-N09_OGT_505m]|nr:CoA pyrophosphatase [SAR202 cluster bacterium AC-647-N09_OGT_505m]
MNKVQITFDSIRESLAHTNSLTVINPNDNPGLVSAGVLLLLYAKDGDICVHLNKRTDRVEHHKGEISFPGGAQDPEDATILDTALREAYEEMGIHRKDVEILCRLDQVTTRSLFSITPFVGIIPSAYPFQASGIEVKEILEVPIPVLLDPSNWRETRRAGDTEQNREYAYAYGEHLIWGATARILTQFLGLIASG